MRRILVNLGAFLLGFIVIGLVIYAMSVPALNNIKGGQVADDTVVTEINYSGGLCVSGETCSVTYAIYGDGTFTDHSSLTEEELQSLIIKINTSSLDNVEASTSGLCPSAYDGSDISFKFPTKYADRIFVVCQIKDSEKIELFNFVSNLVEKHSV